MAGAGGPALGYRLTFGVQPWLVFLDGGTVPLAGRLSRPMKDFSPGGDAEFGAVLVHMAQAVSTACGMQLCGVPTGTRPSGAARFLLLPTGLGVRIKGLGLPPASS